MVKSVPELRRQTCIIAGTSGILGIVLLIISFNINPGPPAGANLDQLTHFARRYYDSILWGLAAGGSAGIYNTFCICAGTFIRGRKQAIGLDGFLRAGNTDGRQPYRDYLLHRRNV